jgi:hypothetical protein
VKSTKRRNVKCHEHLKALWQKYKVVYSPLHNKRANEESGGMERMPRGASGGRMLDACLDIFQRQHPGRLNGILRGESLLMLFLSVLIYLHHPPAKIDGGVRAELLKLGSLSCNGKITNTSKYAD